MGGYNVFPKKTGVRIRWRSTAKFQPDSSVTITTEETEALREMLEVKKLAERFRSAATLCPASF
jgi:hypothetical protein